MAATVSKNLSELVDHLIYKLNKGFSESGEVDLTECLGELENYYGTDWQKYAKFDDKKGFNRVNIYLEGRKNQHFDVWLICWSKGANSGIHNHADNGCIQRVLTGVIKETRYRKCNRGKKKGQFEETDVNKLRQGNVGFIDNDIGYHRMENKSNTQEAVTLHIYSPPNYDTVYYKSDGEV